MQGIIAVGSTLARSHTGAAREVLIRTVAAGICHSDLHFINELSAGGVHHAFECVGLKQTTEQAFGMLRPGGTATVIGMVPVGTRIELHGADFLRERRIQGCMMGSNRFRVDMPRLVEFYLQGRLTLAEMVSGRLPPEAINEGFAALRTGGVARNLIMFD